MNTVEDAYVVIVQTLFKACTLKEWKVLSLSAPILSQNLGGTSAIQRSIDDTESDIPLGFEIFDIQKAVFFLREDLIKNNMGRIWGIDFKLFPDGNFKINYDYNKPDGYEDSDETIGGSQANEGLSRL